MPTFTAFGSSGHERITACKSPSSAALFAARAPSSGTVDSRKSLSSRWLGDSDGRDDGRLIIAWSWVQIPPGPSLFLAQDLCLLRFSASFTRALICLIAWPCDSVRDQGFDPPLERPGRLQAATANPGCSASAVAARELDCSKWCVAATDPDQACHPFTYPFALWPRAGRALCPPRVAARSLADNYDSPCHSFYRRDPRRFDCRGRFH